MFKADVGWVVCPLVPRLHGHGIESDAHCQRQISIKTQTEKPEQKLLAFPNSERSVNYIGKV